MTKLRTDGPGPLRYIERLLWMVALTCGAWCLQAWWQAHVAGETSEAMIVHATSVRREARANEVIGRMEIPALRLSVPILENAENTSLEAGVGHIPTTAMPGGLGTVGLAGHRDTFLRPLRKIAPGMEIRLADANGTYHYVVDSTEIVLPADVRVLGIADQPSLAIVTCYPFYYVGSAPKRFIVHAHLVSVIPD